MAECLLEQHKAADTYQGENLSTRQNCDRVSSNRVVDCDEQEVVLYCLSDQEAIKRIAVQWG